DEPARCLRGRERARTGELDRLGDLGPRLLLARLDAERALQPQDRVELLPVLGGQRLAVELRVALVVAAQAMGEALEEEGPAARARRAEEPAEGVAHGAQVVAVDRRSLDPPRRDHVAHPLDRRVRRARRELGEAVVLADEDR